MPTDITVTLQEKGATSRFILTIISKGVCPNKVATVITIEGANVCFQTMLDKQNCHNLFITFRKGNVVCDIPYKTNVTCKALNYSMEWICREIWNNWIKIGNLKSDKKNDVYLSVAEVTVTMYRHTVKSLRHLKFYEDTDLTDFHLSAEDGSVAVHRAFLAANSEVFKTILTGKSKETEEGLIELEGVTLQTLQHLKKYLYLGMLPKDGLQQLLLLAKQYGIEDLKTECITKLALTVLPEGLNSLLKFACAFKIPELCLAIAQLTPDDVIHQTHKKRRMQEDSQQAADKPITATE